MRSLTVVGKLRIPKDVVKHSIRQHAEDVCTEQLGFRTIADALESERREVNALNVTGLDKSIQKRACVNSAGFTELELPSPDQEGGRSLHIHHLAARLQVLQKLGLARQQSPSRWRLDSDFHLRMRTLQRENDRQRNGPSQIKGKPSFQKEQIRRL